MKKSLKSPLRFDGVVAFFVEAGLKPARLKVWKDKIKQLGGNFETHLSKRLTHIFGVDMQSLLDRIGPDRMKKLAKLKVLFLRCEWIEDSLKAGSLFPTEPYLLLAEKPDYSSASSLELSDASASDGEDVAKPVTRNKRKGLTPEQAGSGDAKKHKEDEWMKIIQRGATIGVVGHKEEDISTEIKSDINREATYDPPNLNKNITSPFEELKNLYKDALGDDRRSFSYYKALSVLEKVPFKITSADQVKGLPTIDYLVQAKAEYMRGRSYTNGRGAAL